jgi:DNA-binding NtrC family response regulator
MNRPKILVVDSDKNIISAFGNYLRKKNCSMTGVNSADAGLNKIHQQKFNLMITDIRVNSEFGTSFITRAKEAQKNLPVIAITSFPDQINESDLKKYGADYFFIKPLELSKLDKAIETCLKSNLINNKDHKYKITE